MKEKGNGRHTARRGFRLEWEGRGDGSGRIYLFGVRSFGAYEEKRKCFRVDAGSVSVYGELLSVQTFRSGAVEVLGRIAGVSFAPGREDDGFAAD